MAPISPLFVSRLVDNGTDMNRTEIRLFLIFLLVGGAGNIAMLLTAIFSKHVHRHVTWLSFCVAWIIFSLSYTLLLFTGSQFSEDLPSYSLCVTQAALIYGAPVISAAVTLALVSQMWLSLRRIITAGTFSPPREFREWDTWLTVIPYITWFAVILGNLIVGIRSPEDVARTETSVYCFIKTNVPGHISAGVAAALLIITVVLEILIGTFIYKYWAAYSKTRTPNSISLSLVVRAGFYVILNVVTVSQIGMFFANDLVVANIWISLSPLAVVVVFATQEDMLRVWTFRPIK